MLSANKIHFIGICGTLMGNAAVCFKNQGREIKGSDKAFYPPMSDMLMKNGMEVFEGFSVDNLRWNPDLVVVGNSISRGNPELEYVLDQKMEYISLPELLRHWFVGRKDSIVVSGTHGKTTTTSMISGLFESAGRDPSYIIGGIPKGKDSGFVEGKGNEVILEGDEYDTAFFDKRSKFLHYRPKTVIINNIEFDHSDIFNNLDEIKLTFKRLVNIVPQSGHLVVNFDDKNVRGVCEKAHSKIESFGMGALCKWKIENIQHKLETTSFTIRNLDRTYNLKVPSCGLYQVFNYTAACIAAFLYGIDDETIQLNLGRFSGVKRRMEYRGKINGCEIFEDFAHHPTAIGHVLDEIRQKHPVKKIIALFEPRSNTTRRNIFQNELAEAFSKANISIIAKIDREELLSDDDKLDIKKLILDVEKSGNQAFYIPNFNELAEKVLETVDENHVCVIMSNGAFGSVFKKIGL